MGFGMASHLVKIGHHVIGLDVFEPSLARFREAGGKTSHSPREAAEGVEFFICMVANSKQADSVLFDPDKGAVEGKEFYNSMFHFMSRSWISYVEGIKFMYESNKIL